MPFVLPFQNRRQNPMLAAIWTFAIFVLLLYGFFILYWHAYSRPGIRAVLIPTADGPVAGYIPFKATPVAPEQARRRAVTVTVLVQRSQLSSDNQPDTATAPAATATESGVPECPQGKHSCQALGHPEICCLGTHTCLQTNHTLTGVYCCGSPDPVNEPCDETNLSCEVGYYECPAEVNGGCCAYGQRCGLLECFDGGGPPAPTSASTMTITSTLVDLNGDGLVGPEEPTEDIRTTEMAMSNSNATKTTTENTTTSDWQTMSITGTDYTTPVVVVVTSTSDSTTTQETIDANGAPVGLIATAKAKSPGTVQRRRPGWKRLLRSVWTVMILGVVAL